MHLQASLHGREISTSIEGADGPGNDAWQRSLAANARLRDAERRRN